MYMYIHIYVYVYIYIYMYIELVSRRADVSAVCIYMLPPNPDPNRENLNPPSPTRGIPKGGSDHRRDPTVKSLEINKKTRLMHLNVLLVLDVPVIHVYTRLLFARPAHRALRTSGISPRGADAYMFAKLQNKQHISYMVQ